MVDTQSISSRIRSPSSALKLHLHNAVPVSEALVTGLAVGELPRKASGTLVTADTRHSLLTNTVARHSVALRSLNPTPVTVTRCRGRKREDR